VVVTELAEASVAYYLGGLVVMSGVPIVGLILLIVGLRQRSRASQLPPGYPPPGPYPYGPPSNTPVDISYPHPAGPPAPPTPPQYYPGPQPAPRPPRSGIGLIVVGSLLLASGLLGIIGGATHLVEQNLNTAKSPGVGQCIAASNFREHTSSPKAQDCAEPDSIFEVVTRGSASSTCPDGKTEDSDYAFLRDGSTTLCFVLNFVQDRCYTASGDAHAPLFAATDCDGSSPRFKVVNRIDGSSDSDLCPSGTKAIDYQVPARLYCLEPLKS
jgi:hypothetical protein